MKHVKTFPYSEWKPKLSLEDSKYSIHNLENGSILFFPNLAFHISEDEQDLFSSNLVQEGHKTITFDISSNKIYRCQGEQDVQNAIRSMMHRFANYAKNFIHQLCPQYKEHLSLGKTCFHPVEIRGCKSLSYKDNDSLLHIDSFPKEPTQGKRILRFCANVNPFHIPQVWKIGDDYKEAIKRYIPTIKGPVLGVRSVLKHLKLTNSYRALYDHYMLGVHDKMMSDLNFQKNTPHERVAFPPFSCWLAFTDQLVHGVQSGQYSLEQNFYLPIANQEAPSKSPLVYMEKLLQRNLRD